MSSVSASQPSRRQVLRNQRRWKFLQGIWRLILLIGLSGGLGWILSHPQWLIRSAAQIEIEGNELVSDGKIETLLGVSYPQTLWRFPSQTLEQQLEQQPPLDQVNLTRKLFPPQIVLNVEERTPIAFATSQTQTGFLDSEGVFIPASFYQSKDKRLQFPLKVLGYLPTYREQWQSLYPHLQEFPLKIQQLDWRNPNNLILHTELGRVHLGTYKSHFPQQLTVLVKMKTLSSRIPQDRLNYIDISNPEQPTIQLKY
ncbi:MAG: cell division protein FtsQ/DivIB [Microcystaceae cyanobacterium]